MNRTLTLIAAAVVAVGLFAGLVHAVLVAARVSEPAAETVYGSTPQRNSATIATALALIGASVGAWSLVRPIRWGPRWLGGAVALVMGLMGGVNGVLVLSAANGGPGSGNGVVGGAMAIVMGLAAVGLGGGAVLRIGRAQPVQLTHKG